MKALLLWNVLLGVAAPAPASECSPVAPETARAVVALGDSQVRLVKVVPAGCNHYVVMDAGAGTLVTRLLPSGQVDAAFGDASGSVFVPVVGTVRDAVAGDDGSLLVAAEFGDSNGRLVRTVFRVLPDGSLDRSFGTAGVLTLRGAPLQAVSGNATSSLVALGGGRWLLVFANARGKGSGGELVLMRFDRAGNPDASYGDGGTLRVVRPNIRAQVAAAPGPSGHILVGVETDKGMELLELDGSREGVSLTLSGMRLVPQVASVDGAIIGFGIRRDGTLFHVRVPAKDPHITLLDGFGAGSYVHAVTVLKDGSYFIAKPDPRGVRVEHLEPNGKRLPGFGRNGTVILPVGQGSSRPQSLVALPGGGVLVGLGSTSGALLFRLDAAGSLSGHTNTVAALGHTDTRRYQWLPPPVLVGGVEPTGARDNTRAELLSRELCNATINALVGNPTGMCLDESNAPGGALGALLDRRPDGRPHCTTRGCLQKVAAWIGAELVVTASADGKTPATSLQVQLRNAASWNTMATQVVPVTHGAGGPSIQLPPGPVLAAIHKHAAGEFRLRESIVAVTPPVMGGRLSTSAVVVSPGERFRVAWDAGPPGQTMEVVLLGGPGSKLGPGDPGARKQVNRLYLQPDGQWRPTRGGALPSSGDMAVAPPDGASGGWTLMLAIRNDDNAALNMPSDKVSMLFAREPALQVNTSLSAPLPDHATVAVEVLVGGTRAPDAPVVLVVRRQSPDGTTTRLDSSAGQADDEGMLVPQRITAWNELQEKGEYRYVATLLDARSKAVLAEAESKVRWGPKARVAKAESGPLGAGHIVRLTEIPVKGALAEDAARNIPTLLAQELKKQLPGLKVVPPSDGPPATADEAPTHAITGSLGKLGNTVILNLTLLEVTELRVTGRSSETLCNESEATVRLALARGVERLRGKDLAPLEKVCAPAR